MGDRSRDKRGPDVGPILLYRYLREIVAWKKVARVQLENPLVRFDEDWGGDRFAILPPVTLLVERG